MDIRISCLGIEAARGFIVSIVHSNAEWRREIESTLPMVEEDGEWVLHNTEDHLQPDEQFKIGVLGFTTQSDAFSAYCTRHDAGLVIGGPAVNHPDNPDLRVKKFFWDDRRKIMFLLVPGYEVYLTPGGNWNNRFTRTLGNNPS